ncbi:MAG TPA: hypothetical protein VF898_07735 [Chloroflexota bacterium]
MTGSPHPGNKQFDQLTPFHLRAEVGDIVLEPEHEGQGYWVGAPGILYDLVERCWWLTYRRRRPRGMYADVLGERGYLARVARSTDGLHFDDVWEVRQDEWNTPSMERFSLVRDGDIYRLFVSYVDPADNRWRIDFLEADHPSRFEAASLHPALTADDVSHASNEQVEGVKDPWVFRVGSTWHMLISYAARGLRTAHDAAIMHQTADVYNTGLITAPTGLGTSSDGRHWQWEGQILHTGGPGTWDRYQSRLNSLVPLAGFWLGFYDGSASHQENYEERCGLATSTDLRHWTRLTSEQPAIVAPHGTRSVRYVEAIRQVGTLHCYYEYARPNGSHDLRRLVVGIDEGWSLW